MDCRRHLVWNLDPKRKSSGGLRTKQAGRGSCRECYCEPITYSSIPHISDMASTKLVLEEWEAWQLGYQAGDSVQSLVNKMMMDNHVNLVGSGLVGRVAFTGKHQWIFSQTYTREAHPPEVLNELSQQFSAGMQTVAVIPVLPHGVIQLGSSLAIYGLFLDQIMENMAFVYDVKTLFLQLGWVPGTLLSDNYEAKEPAGKTGIPVHNGKSVSADMSVRSEVPECNPSIGGSFNQEGNSLQPSGLVCQSSNSLVRQIQDNLQSIASTFRTRNISQSFIKLHGNHCQVKVTHAMEPNLPIGSQLENRVTAAKVVPSNSEAWIHSGSSTYVPRSRYDKPLCAGPLTADYGSFRLNAKQIFSDNFVQGHPNKNSTASNGFTASRRRTNDGLASISNEDSNATKLTELSEFQKGVGNCPLSISKQCSLSNASRLANKSTSNRHVANTNLSETYPSASDYAEHSNISHLLPSSSAGKHCSNNEKCGHIQLAESAEKTANDIYQALGVPLPQAHEHLASSQSAGYGCQNPRLLTAKCEDTSVGPVSGDDLFDIFGVDFKGKLYDGIWNKFLNSGPDTSKQNLGKSNCASMTGSEIYSVNDGNSDSGIFSTSGSDHLLDAVVSRVHSTTRRSSSDALSCRTTTTKITSPSGPIDPLSSGQANVSKQMEDEFFSLPNSLAKAGSLGSCSFRSGSCKDIAGMFPQTSSIYGSQISSWVEQGLDVKPDSSVSTGYSKRPDEISKSNRKRLKPGENPRPRPKDRQMIQDRVKELREIVPNGAKCSIDALLERTIKHMVFLQSVTKHADKLRQTGEPKIIGKEGGLLLKDNFEGGATWAYELGSQSMVCPIIVEDLNPPRQMLVEMLCEERGWFLEIADIIRGLGLTILKGVMETRNDKIWARFAVEANRDVTRMEVFISLARLLEQTVRGSAPSANCTNNENMTVHQSFHQAASLPATGSSTMASMLSLIVTTYRFSGENKQRPKVSMKLKKRTLRSGNPKKYNTAITLQPKITTQPIQEKTIT
ncbi:hypothetical protein RJ639_044360 [Escallonia herrerae]|uniref:BHLH domain-containing protein n=1 Tax=Escallonia herrerae TaxID=1293975 RepID=A0AA88WNM1_9ASTE|nr:hypothetical protein RJ639_044360 [Escallonia herrerae]